MDKIVWKGSPLLAPVPPVLVSCKSGEKENLITIAWTGIVNSKPAKTYISVQPIRYSYDLIKSSGEFVINLPTAAMVRGIDLCGVKSGRDTDKFVLAKFTPEKANEVDCPLVKESPVNLECKVTDIIELGSHHMFIADILCVDVNPDIITEKGRLNLAKAGLMAYAHGEYFALGKRIGSFGCSVKKRRTK